MNFFENQDVARRQTGRLVLLFILAVLAIVAMLYGIAVGIVGYRGQDPYTGAVRWAATWWDPKLLAQVVLATLVIVGGGSLYKMAQLRGGGRIVAEGLGGRPIPRDSRDALERRVLNVVDEMAIASGTPAPPVYLLDDETGINAFAAGFTPSDAVIGVTRGCAERLSRDQLQGVIAHEFSHILNGDMRLNIRLMGVIHGILIIGIIGYFILRSSLFVGASRGRGGRDNSGAALLVLGAGLMAIGFLGTFFGNLIKASVSRQREFLADASAVQFTRNPDGIAGALKKIGGFSEGSRIESPNAPEASHMFFSQGITSGLNSMFSTHPPLEDRIQRLDPSWTPPARWVRRSGERAAASTAAAAASGLAAGSVAAMRAVGQIGQPTPEHIDYAARLLEGLPAQITAAAREPYGARAVIYALLINRDPEAREAQLQRLARCADPAVSEETERLLPFAEQLDTRTRLPLVDLAISALRSLSPSQYEVFEMNVVELVKADHKIDLFEWTLQRILLRHLRPQFEPVKPARPKYDSLSRFAHHCNAVLSTLAYVGHQTGEASLDSFERAASDLGLPHLTMLPADQCGLARLDEALSVLAELKPLVKRRFIEACAGFIAADGRITVGEAEILRAVADSLDCPMPPLLPGQALA